MTATATHAQKGKLRIGDDWNAISIIALSQSNPLKAVAEFVENSIDAGARHVTIIRGREKGVPYLRVKDDGQGVPLNGDGLPDFHYVATHICDSIKRRLKDQGGPSVQGIQGEFGIGLLSFWTVGEELALASPGADGKVYQMHMRKGQPTYQIVPRRLLFSERGTELTVKRILPCIRQFSGEKIQWYLASELRDRIRTSGVKIKVVDRSARAEFQVEPRKFDGRLLHELVKPGAAPPGLYLELYLNRHDPAQMVGLYRSGTRVIENMAGLEPFQKPPWTSGYLQGIVDAAFLNLTPGTRLGVIHDAALRRLIDALVPVEERLLEIIEEQQNAEDDKATRDVLRSIQRAFKEALLALPAEEYDWFPVRPKDDQAVARPDQPVPATDAGLVLNETGAPQAPSLEAAESDAAAPPQKEFFEYAGPLFSVKISPASSVVAVNKSRNLRAIPRDRAHHLVEENLEFNWQIIEGAGRLENDTAEIATFHAPPEPVLTRVQAAVRQNEILCQAEALVTVTDSLLPEARSSGAARTGLPGYTFQKAPGELWRSRFDADRNLVVINNGHRDFVFASRNRARKLRYLCRLFAKELVLKNFVGTAPDQMLERLIELSLYTEEHLK